MTPEEKQKIIEAFNSKHTMWETGDPKDWGMGSLRFWFEDFINAMPEESDCKHLSRTVGDDGWFCNDCDYITNDLDTMPEESMKSENNVPNINGKPELQYRRETEGDWGKFYDENSEQNSEISGVILPSGRKLSDVEPEESEPVFGE